MTHALKFMIQTKGRCLPTAYCYQTSLWGLRSDQRVFKQQPASKQSFQPSLPSVRPPWNTVGVSGHSFHCVRTGLRSEETVNGHLEVGENICLWRHGGLVIPQWNSASHVFLFSQLMDFGIVLLVLFFLTKSKSCRYLSICWRENHLSSDHIRQLMSFCFPI